MAVPIASDTKLWEKFVMNRGWTWGGFDGKYLVASVTRLGDFEQHPFEVKTALGNFWNNLGYFLF